MHYLVATPRYSSPSIRGESGITNRSSLAICRPAALMSLSIERFMLHPQPMIVAAPVLEKHIGARGFEHSSDLSKRRCHICNRAQGERRDDPVKRFVFEWQASSRIELQSLDWHVSSCDSICHSAGQHPLTIDGGQPGHLRRVAGQIQASTETDLEHLSTKRRERRPSLVSDWPPPERQLDKTWKDML